CKARMQVELCHLRSTRLLNKPYATSQSFEMHQIGLLSISNMWVISRLCSPFDTCLDFAAKRQRNWHVQAPKRIIGEHLRGKNIHSAGAYALRNDRKF